MKFSKKWIQEYITETLPEDKLIERELNAKAFEVEGVELVNGDSIFDIKVLPNRAHDALGHYGMASEWAACLGLTLKSKSELFKNNFDFDTNLKNVEVEVGDTKACSRFMSVRISGVKVGESSAYIKEKLEAIGERSINNIVDITNYVQFTLNKPMHAYDAKNVEGKILVRYAEEEEKLVTLDDRELTLNSKTLIIADEKKALGLAGIKGGKWSGVNSDTNEIIIESANFESTLIRKTSQKYDIRTAASKRFENGIADSLVEDGLMMTISEILKLFPNAKVSVVTDTNPNKSSSYTIGITKEKINSILGADLSNNQIESVFGRLGLSFRLENSTYTVDIPNERLDLRLEADIAEEVGRIIGFEKLVPTLPILNRKGKQNKKLYYQNVVRNLLFARGFSEVMTYSFTEKGEVALLKSASNKNRMRTNLTEGLIESFQKNMNNGPLLKISTIKTFEFGSCFTADREWNSLAILIDDGKKKSNFSEEVDMILSEIKVALGLEALEYQKTSVKPCVVEMDFENIIPNLDDKDENSYLSSEVSDREVKYKSFSMMPFIVRDVAFWCDVSVDREDLKKDIAANAGGLCIDVSIFDEFEKDGRKSLGYRLIYQDKDRTLTDEEVNGHADNVYKLLKDKGFEIR